MDNTLDNRDIGNRIRELRERLGYTRDEFSNLIGISTTFLARIERAEKTMSLATFSKIAKGLNVSADFILYGNNPIDRQDINAIIKQIPIKELKVVQDILSAILPYLRK